MQEEIIKKITGYWQHGFGRVYNPDRSEALDRVQYLPDIASAVAEIKKLTGKVPVTITTDARIYPNTITYKAARQMLHEGDRPVLVLFGTGFGMEKETMAAFDYILERFTARATITTCACAALLQLFWTGWQEKHGGKNKL